MINMLFVRNQLQECTEKFLDTKDGGQNSVNVKDQICSPVKLKKNFFFVHYWHYITFKNDTYICVLFSPVHVTVS